MDTHDGLREAFTLVSDSKYIAVLYTYLSGYSYMVPYGKQTRIPDFLKGGGGERTFTSTHPLDISCVTSSTLRKIDKHPRFDIHRHPPPLGHCPCDGINIPRGGGGDWSRSRTLCIGFQDQDKFKGGGVITPVTHPPLDPPLERHQGKDGPLR